VPPHKQELTRVTRYLTTQLAKAGVEVRLNTEVTDAVTALARAEDNHWTLFRRMVPQFR